MGSVFHHVLIVTASEEEAIRQAYKKAQELFPEVTPIFETPSNVYWTFFIPPDGSKEGWPDSDAGNQRREEFHIWLADQIREVWEINPYQVVEVAYGEVAFPVVSTVNGRRICDPYP